MCIYVPAIKFSFYSEIIQGANLVGTALVWYFIIFFDRRRDFLKAEKYFGIRS